MHRVRILALHRIRELQIPAGHGEIKDEAVRPRKMHC